MNQNKNTSYYFESHYCPNDRQQNNGMSVFDFETNESLYLEQDKKNRRDSFNAFIDSRTLYLNGLSKLGDNWISGSSKQPTDQSINLSKEIINNLGNWYANKGYEQYVYPKVIMSPTPSGGIAMEIETFPDTRAYISILNEDISYEIEKDGFFVEKYVTKNDISNQLLTLYTSNERGYYSEW